MTDATHASAENYLKAQSRWHPLEIVFWLAALLPYLLFPDYLSLASQIAITALFALSLDLILGYAGVVSLGHAAFFGIGAYATVHATRAGIPWEIAIVLGGSTAAIIGIGFAFVALRVKGLYLALQSASAGAESTPPQARVILLSGCMDNQLSRDGDRNGQYRHE